MLDNLICSPTWYFASTAVGYQEDLLRCGQGVAFGHPLASQPVTGVMSLMQKLKGVE
jgi:hypothetical protein